MMKLLSEIRIFCFEKDANRRAQVHFKKSKEWVFDKCDYSFDACYNLEDWRFLGEIATKIEELLKALNKTKK